MGRLIDADVVEKALREYADDVGCKRGEYELANGILKAVGYIRHNIPTAYDVEKVVAELEEEKEIACADFDKYVNDYELDLDNEYDDWFHRGLERAVVIVKRGGVE